MNEWMNFSLLSLSTTISPFFLLFYQLQPQPLLQGGNIAQWLSTQALIGVFWDLPLACKSRLLNIQEFFELILSCWWLEIGCSGSIHTMEINKWCTLRFRGLFLLHFFLGVCLSAHHCSDLARPGFVVLLCHSLIVWPWTTCLISLTLFPHL